MTDSSNFPKHSSQLSKKISKKGSRLNPIATGINTHEEEKLEIAIEIPFKDNEDQPKKKEAVIESDSENEEDMEVNIEEVKNSKNSAHKNQDKIAEISHYLILKNKINAKNAFDIPMLNVKEMTAFNKIEQDFAWKNLSSALEAGAKIYGFRVDSVHSETYKILGGLNRTELEELKEGEEEGKQNNELRPEEFLISRRRNETTESNTLEKNINNISTQKYDLEFDVDPLFSKTSAKFDEAGSKGLLLNNTSINSNLELLFDIQNPKKDIEPAKNITDNRRKFYRRFEILGEDFQLGTKIFDKKICPEINSFQEEIKNDQTIFNASKYFPSAEKLLRSGEKLSADNENSNNFNMNIFTASFAASDDYYLNELDFPDLTQPNVIPEVNEEQYEKEHEQAEPNEDSNMNNHTRITNQLNMMAHYENNMEISAKREESMDQMESKFNLNSVQEKNVRIGTGRTLNFNFVDIGGTKWMGPEQWKIKLNAANATKPTSRPTRPAPVRDSEFKEREKSKKKARAIDFDLTTQERSYDIFGKNSKKGGYSTLMLRVQENLPIKHSYLLPMDHHIDINRLGKTFLRDPTLNMTMAADPEDVDLLFPEVPNTEQKQKTENEEMPEEEHNVLMEIEDRNDTVKREIQKGTIPIKELKEKIWNKMQTLKKFEGKGSKNSRMVLEDEDESMSPQRRNFGYRFATLVNMLPDIVGPSAKRVSVQTCFVTMLHLANEKILKLSNLKGENCDFFIEKEKA